MTYEEIDALRLKAFMTNGDADRKAYFDGASKWFQDEVFRRMDRATELATLRAENEILRERVKAAEYVLKQARPESGYWDTYAKEALK